MESYDILLVIMTIAFVFSMLVWIMVGVLVIQVLKKVKTAAEKAEHVADNVEAFTSHLKNAGKASAVGSIIKQVTKAFKGGKDNG